MRFAQSIKNRPLFKKRASTNNTGAKNTNDMSLKGADKTRQVDTFTVLPRVSSVSDSVGFGQRKKPPPLVYVIMFGLFLFLWGNHKNSNNSRTLSGTLDNLTYRRSIEKDSTRNWVLDEDFKNYLIDYSNDINSYSPSAELLAFYMECGLRRNAGKGKYVGINQLEKAQFMQFVLDNPRLASDILYNQSNRIDVKQLGWVDGQAPKKRLTVKKARSKHEQTISDAQLQYLTEITQDFKDSDEYTQFDVFKAAYVKKWKGYANIDGFHSLSEVYLLKLWPDFLRKAKVFRADVAAGKYLNKEEVLEAYENLVVLDGNRRFPKKPKKGASAKEWKAYHKKYRAVKHERAAYRANKGPLDVNKDRTGNTKIITVRDIHQALIKPVLKSLALNTKGYRAMLAGYNTATESTEKFWGNATLRYDAAQAFRFADEEYFENTGKHIPLTMAYCNYEEKDGWQRPPWQAVLLHASGDCIQIPDKAHHRSLCPILEKYGFVAKETDVKNYRTKEIESWRYFQYEGSKALGWGVSTAQKDLLAQLDFSVMDWSRYQLPE